MSVLLDCSGQEVVISARPSASFASIRSDHFDLASMAMLPGTQPEDFPAAVEWVTLTTHNGTHLLASYHFHSTMDAKNAPYPI